jgi:copper/silver efflux system protein
VTMRDLYESVMEGAVERLRPKMMTTLTIILGLLPIMWGTGTGASTMKRIAAPMVGGMISSTLLTLLVIPAMYSLWREWGIRRKAGRGPAPVPVEPVRPEPVAAMGE